MALIEAPLVHPDRKTSRIRPLKAWRHFRKLVADKEDTAQVFHIIESLKGKRSHRQAWDFIASEEASASSLTKPTFLPCWTTIRDGRTAGLKPWRRIISPS